MRSFGLLHWWFVALDHCFRRRRSLDSRALSCDNSEVAKIQTLASRLHCIDVEGGCINATRLQMRVRAIASRDQSAPSYQRPKAAASCHRKNALEPNDHNKLRLAGLRGLSQRRASLHMQAAALRHELGHGVARKDVLARKWPVCDENVEAMLWWCCRCR